MEARRKALDILARYERAGLKTAAKGSMPPWMEKEGPTASNEPPASGVKRDIPKGHDFDPKSLKPLTRMLWAMSVSLGHALTAYRQFNRVKSISVSPDGMVGGRGYVMSVKDIRQRLYDACEALSSISDTIHDEVNAPHWKSKLGELEKEDLEDVEKLLGEAEHNLEDPEEEADEELEDTEKKKTWHHPAEKLKTEEGRSKLPEAGNASVDEEQGPSPAANDRPALQKQASAYTYSRTANSSLPVQTLPGPRVDHLDRAEQTGPFGSYNQDEPVPDDQWGRDQGVGNDYAYPSEWENNLSEREGTSALPSDGNPKKNDAWDFGIGYGARGEGAGGYGEANPSSGGKGVYGPRAELPDDPGGKMHDDVSDTTPSAELSLSNRNLWAALPGDDLPPVARSDYYTGPKGNDTNVVIRSQTKLPGQGAPGQPAPVKPRPATLQEHMFSADESGLPGDESVTYDYEKDLPGVGYKYERTDQPYTKWDDSTHQQRVDPTFMRDPVQGPYVKQ